MTSICLCMIVKNETETLKRNFDSVRDLISHWVICDTGSTDGTQDLIRRELAGIPGELHEHEWVNFGHNRTLLMELAKDKADYLLLLDADWTVDYEPGAFDGLTADSYLVRHAGGVEFHNKRLVSGRLDWRYHGVTHEFIASEQEETSERLEGVIIHHWADGGSRDGRWEQDARLLEAELVRNPGDPRSTFYLAQTYRDLRRLDQARERYRQRVELGGWLEEVYYSWYQVAGLSVELDDWPTAVDAYLRAWETLPQRMEAVHDMAVGLRVRELYHAAHRLTSLAAGLEPLPIPDDSLFVAPWIYRWGLLFEYSISTYWVGELDQSIAACDRLLAQDDLPDNYREQTRSNRSFAINAKAADTAERARGLARGWSPFS